MSRKISRVARTRHLTESGTVLYLAYGRWWILSRDLVRVKVNRLRPGRSFLLEADGPPPGEAPTWYHCKVWKGTPEANAC